MENNYNDWSIEQIDTEIERLESLAKDYKNEEQGIKLTLNSIYGALGNQWFALFNPDVAEAVTLQGQDIWKYAERIINKYFQQHWHLDTELHEKMGVKNVKQITKDMVIYGDTDSCFSMAMLDIYTNSNKEKMTISELFEYLMEPSNIKIDGRGNEIIENPDFKVLNWKNGLLYSPVKKLIRHKVRKAKWRLTTETGKEIIITNDHSMVVFRNGEKVIVKPCEINIETDKILEVYGKDESI